MFPFVRVQLGLWKDVKLVIKGLLNRIAMEYLCALRRTFSKLFYYRFCNFPNLVMMMWNYVCKLVPTSCCYLTPSWKYVDWCRPAFVEKGYITFLSIDQLTMSDCFSESEHGNRPQLNFKKGNFSMSKLFRCFLNVTLAALTFSVTLNWITYLWWSIKEPINF